MKDALGHGSNGRGADGKKLFKPLLGHAYHAKTNDQLRYIIKDASEAEKATRGMSMYNPNSGKREDTAGKYSDQVNDAATVLAYRDRGGKSEAPSDQLHSGTPKSEAAPVHDSMGHGPFPSNADFLAKYGPPRDHAAEQRSFNRGKREINRLRKQGQ